MTTVGKVIEQTLGELLSGSREQYNKLLEDIAADDDHITFEHPTKAIQTGAIIDIGTEDVFVWDCDQASRTATVERGQRGTAVATHPGGTIVTVNPRFSHAQLFEALNQELHGLAGDLYQVKTQDLVSSAVQYTYDLDALPDLLDVYAVYYDAVGPENYWPELHGWDIRLNQGSEFSSGQTLRLSNNSLVPARTLRIVYFAGFALVESVDDDLETVSGIAPSMADIVRLGMQIRMMGVRESKRTFTEAQPDTRRSAEVPAGSSPRAVGALMQLYRDRINDERKKLSQRYPQKRG